MTTTSAAIPFLIGADPEIFLKKNNKFISVEDKNGPLIPGNKQNPYEVNGGAIQVDGVAAEFNVNPTGDFRTFYNNVRSVITTMRDMIKSKDNEISLIPVPTATFDKNYFFDLPKHTLELGCDPDFDAYKNGAPNPRPSTNEPFRTGSGHIHIGWGNNLSHTSTGHMEDCILVVKQLDKYLLKASEDWDTDHTRRKLYGNPGSFRPKKYGVEYRPASNAWLNSPKSVQAVFYITLGVMRAIETGKFNLENNLNYLDNYKNKSEHILQYLSNYIPEAFK